MERIWAKARSSSGESAGSVAGGPAGRVGGGIAPPVAVAASIRVGGDFDRIEGGVETNPGGMTPSALGSQRSRMAINCDCSNGLLR